MRALRHNPPMFTDLKIPAGRRPMTRTEAAVAAAAGIAFTLMVLVSIFDQYSAGRLSVLFILLFWVPMLILHEFGHAAAARLLGWRVREIVIGFGRDLWQWQGRETRLRVKLAPVEGYVLPEPRDAGRLRLKSMLIYAAGPGAELLLLVLLLLVFGSDYVFSGSGDVGQVAVQSLAIVILLGAGFNLLPFRSESAVSDGLGIISSPFLSETAIEMRLIGAELRDVQKLLDAGKAAAAVDALHAYVKRFPQNQALQQWLAIALARRGATDNARELIRQKLAAAGTGHADPLPWLRLQARVELESGAPSWLVLDLAIRKVLAVIPGDPEALTIKGAALTMRGDAKAGGELLAEAWRRNDGNVSDAELLAYLAIAAHRIRDSAAAAHFRSCFEQINTSDRLARRVDSAIGQPG